MRVLVKNHNQENKSPGKEGRQLQRLYFTSENIVIDMNTKNTKSSAKFRLVQLSLVAKYFGLVEWKQEDQ